MIGFTAGYSSESMLLLGLKYLSLAADTAARNITAGCNYFVTQVAMFSFQDIFSISFVLLLCAALRLKYIIIDHL